jgi:hypothetical protein
MIFSVLSIREHVISQLLKSPSVSSPAIIVSIFRHNRPKWLAFRLKLVWLLCGVVKLLLESGDYLVSNAC